MPSASLTWLWVMPPATMPTAPLRDDLLCSFAILDTRGRIHVDFELEEPVETDATKFDLLAPTVVRPRRALAAGAPQPAPDELLPDQMTPEVGIVRQFPFSSSSQRMSVICRTLGRRHMDLYCKGAPEKVEGLCRPESGESESLPAESVPADFHTVLHQYTVKGYRVLALAYRRLDAKLHWHQAQRLKRDQVECDMEMTGLLVMQNSLKPQTTPVIETLQRASVRSVMVTGDNLLTAVSVARECGMIPPEAAAVVVTAHPPTGERPAYLEYTTAAADVAPVHSADDEVFVPLWTGAGSYRLAVTGRSWRVLQQHFPHLMARIVVQGTVFARMAPEQKAQLVETLQDQGYTVGMCGDGANDCEALKAAHVGISLSEAEASVAAPFTSKVADITCVPTVMREGRCALTTSFGTFQYMALYSLVQFVSVLLLYKHYSNLGDLQFLYIDLVITTSVAVLMGYTAPAPRLHRRRPAGSLLGAGTLCSILTQMGLAAGAQLAAMYLLERQPWFQPVPPTGASRDVTVVCWENTVVFFVSSYQYLILATAFSKGPPFRRPFYTNRLFLGALLLLSALQTTLVLWPEPHLVSWFGLAPPRPEDRTLRYSLLAVTAGHCVLALSLEKFVFGAEWFKRVTRPCGCKKGPKNRYKLVLREVEADPTWPPLGQKVPAEDAPS
ncbi:putative cation-transporting ATPase 13A3 [Amphibalanus amphitrite]|uniref:Putative cation-transporting ATPase 13A3 n=1 Tax=Amphibalanus amphitrite TaxID=1232801 RepID=A0A6A4VXA3_AMPAM|nr:putative cation-transporting ATPase 13A3 [Amphibalanus amphitrite]